MNYIWLNKGFYPEDDNRIEDRKHEGKVISEEYYNDLFAGQSQGKEIFENEDGYPALREVVRTERELAECRIQELKTFLDTQWRWRNERYSAEMAEIELGLRSNTSESKQNLVMGRKNAVDEINALQNNLKE